MADKFVIAGYVKRVYFGGSSTVQAIGPTFTFDVNPKGFDIYRSQEIPTITLADGRMATISRKWNSGLRSMLWESIPEDNYGTFLFGRSNTTYPDALYFAEASSSSSSYTVYEQAPRYKKIGYPMPYTTYVTWLRGGTIGDDNVDLLVVGFDYQAEGLFFRIYNTNVEDTTPDIIIDFFDASGSVVDTISTSDTLDDGTERFQHDGMIHWGSASGWAKCTLTEMADNGLGISTGDPPSPASVTIDDSVSSDERSMERYYITIRFTTTHRVKFDYIRTYPDSLEYVSKELSDGSRPIWYLYIPDSVSYLRPNQFRSHGWVPIKITSRQFQIVNPASRFWDVRIDFTIPHPDEVPDSSIYEGAIP